MKDSMKTCVYFIGDAHLGMPISGFEGRETALYSFLKHIQETATHLIIMGDLFDFWVEYRHAIRPDYFTALHFLKECVDQGIEVHYLAGNHDFALEQFLPQIIGIIIHHDGVELTLQGKRIYMHHGDGLISQDWAYRYLRKVLRNRFFQRVYKCIHPNCGVWIASRLSKASRKYLVEKYHQEMLRHYRSAAEGYLEKGIDAVFLAHTHSPQLYTYPDGKGFCNPGEWIRRYTYAQLQDGEISLWEYLPDQSPRQISAIAMKYGIS
jgi:UDP-2,3-diacylglucosamine hydrolase